MSIPNLAEIIFGASLVISNVYVAPSVSESARSIFALIWLGIALLVLAVLLIALPAHAESDADNDGFATVLTAPINEAIDAAFSIIGYEENDDD